MGCQVMVEIKVPFPMRKHGVQHNRGTRRIPVGFVTILNKKGGPDVFLLVLLQF
jgi:hypothetical protein